MKKPVSERKPSVTRHTMDDGPKDLHRHKVYIRESVDSLCRDGADAPYMQYLSKSHIKHAKSLFKCPGFLFEYLCDQQDSYKWPKAMRETAKHQSVW